MKAIFVHKNCVLRDSHIAPESDPEGWRLTPATLEAVRALASDTTLVFFYDVAQEGQPDDDSGHSHGDGHALQTLVRQVEAAGGRVDGLITCPHKDEGECACWGAQGGIFWAPAIEFDLHLNECYVLADSVADVTPAYAVGARPLMVLCERSIGAILGNLPDHKDFPVASNLTTAVSYIEVEEEIARQLGHARTPAHSAPPDEIAQAPVDTLPIIKATSSIAQSVQARLRKSRVQMRDLTRWLSFFVLGALGLSLGIAYLLTHLYRVQPFPQFVYFVTLQFISRPVRGALFILLGALVIWVALRSFYRSMRLGLWRKRG